MSGLYAEPAIADWTADEFRAVVAAAATRYFTVVLPYYIDRCFRGDGYELVWALMDAHDRRDLESSRIDRPASRKALRMAEQLRADCPLEVACQHPTQPGYGTLFGYYTEARTVFPLSGVDYGPEVVTRRVIVYEDGFRMAGVSSAALAEEVLVTIFHEYIHCLEAFHARQDRPLAGREEGDSPPPMTRKQARRRDTMAVVKRWTFRIGAIAVAAIAVAVAVAMGTAE